MYYVYHDSMVSIDKNTFEELKNHYNLYLNKDKKKEIYVNSNDENTPIDCIEEMIHKIPTELWDHPDLKIFDPFCGNGNFHLVIYEQLRKKGYTNKTILENTLFFNDINPSRLENVRSIFVEQTYALQITCEDYIQIKNSTMYDLIVGNPPYAKILDNGKRASKNHNLIKPFIEKSLSLLKPNGYLLFITPDNWMSYADRNTLIETITQLQIIHLDIHTAKKYFPKIGSSFTWYIIQNCPYYKNISIRGIWKKIIYESSVISIKRKYIPLFYNNTIYHILKKTIDHPLFEKYPIETSSDLHRYTKKELISNQETEEFKYRLIHTPLQTVYSKRPHKYQDGYKLFISTTDKYSVFIDNCGMTQSIAFIRCSSLEEALEYQTILRHPLYLFINNICRWGNFNNIRILQQFPKVESRIQNIYDFFHICNEEISLIEEQLKLVSI